MEPQQQKTLAGKVKCVLYEDTKGRCLVCGNGPTCPISEMCGPCTTGEAASLDEHEWEIEIPRKDLARYNKLLKKGLLKIVSS
jgi:hypothetical protein